jgi:hypothetical protein
VYVVPAPTHKRPRDNKRDDAAAPAQSAPDNSLGSTGPCTAGSVLRFGRKRDAPSTPLRPAALCHRHDVGPDGPGAVYPIAPRPPTCLGSGRQNPYGLSSVRAPWHAPIDDEYLSRDRLHSAEGDHLRRDILHARDLAQDYLILGQLDNPGGRRCAMLARRPLHAIASSHRMETRISSRRSSRTAHHHRCCADQPGCSRRPARATDATNSTTSPAAPRSAPCGRGGRP